MSFLFDFYTLYLSLFFDLHECVYYFCENSLHLRNKVWVLFEFDVVVIDLKFIHKLNLLFTLICVLGLFIFVKIIYMNVIELGYCLNLMLVWSIFHCSIESTQLTLFF